MSKLPCFFTSKRFFLLFFTLLILVGLFFTRAKKVYADACCGSGYTCSGDCFYWLDYWLEEHDVYPGQDYICTGVCVPSGTEGEWGRGANPTVTYGATPTPTQAPPPTPTPPPEATPTPTGTPAPTPTPVCPYLATCESLDCLNADYYQTDPNTGIQYHATECCPEDVDSCTNAWCQVPGWSCSSADACLASGGKWWTNCKAWDADGNLVCDVAEPGDNRSLSEGDDCPFSSSDCNYKLYYMSTYCNYPPDTIPPACQYLDILTPVFIEPTGRKVEYADHDMCDNCIVDYQGSSDEAGCRQACGSLEWTSKDCSTYQWNRGLCRTDPTDPATEYDPCTKEDGKISACGETSDIGPFPSPAVSYGSCKQTFDGTEAYCTQPGCVRDPKIYGRKAYEVSATNNSLSIQRADYQGIKINETGDNRYFCEVVTSSNSDPKEELRDGGFAGGYHYPLAYYTYSFGGNNKPVGVTFDYQIISGKMQVTAGEEKYFYESGSGSASIGFYSPVSSITFWAWEYPTSFTLSNLKFFTYEEGCPTSNQVVLKFNAGDPGGSGISQVKIANRPASNNPGDFSGASWGRKADSSTCTITDSNWANYSPYYLWDWCPASREVGARFKDVAGNENTTVECASICANPAAPEVYSLEPADSNICTDQSDPFGENGWRVESANKIAVFKAIYYTDEEAPSSSNLSDINIAQFNLGTGTDPSNWPLRVMYAEDYAGKSKRFWAFDGSQWQYGSTAQGDSSGERYLVNDIDVGDFTLLGGKDNTRVVASGEYLVVYFAIQFADTFPSDTYDQILYVKSLEGFDDEATHGGQDNWQGKFVYGSTNDGGNNQYDLHRFGTFTIDECVGTVRVSVYQAEEGAGEACGRTTVYPGGGTITIKNSDGSPNPYLATITMDGSQFYEKIDVPAGTVSITVDPESPWLNNGDCERTHPPPPKQADLLTFSATVEYGETTEVDFYVRQQADAWLQTEGGDVHSGGDIVSSIPPTCEEPGCTPYFSLPGEGGYPGVVFYSGDYDFDLNADSRGREMVSSESWLVQRSLSRRSYSYFYQILGSPEEDNFNDLGDITEDGVYYSADEVVINSNFPEGRKAVVLVNGDVKVARDITIEEGSGGSLVVVALGDIVFADSVSRAQGIFIADGVISTGSGNVGFVGEGSFIGGGVSLGRDFGDTRNNTAPVEKFVFRPDLWMNTPEELWQASYTWEEIAP